MSRLSKRSDEFQRQPSTEQLVAMANNAIDAVEQQLTEANYSLDTCLDAKSILTQLGSSLDAFVQTVGGLESQRALWPVNKRIEEIEASLTLKVLDSGNMNMWYEYLRFRIDQFINMMSVDSVKRAIATGLTDMSLMVSNIKSSVSLIEGDISTYEKKFGSTFDPSLRAKFEAHINELEAEFKLFLGDDKVSTQAPLKVETIDSDKLLDLYQELEKMPMDDPSRPDKIREFERMQRILKSSRTMKTKKSKRTFSRDFRKESLKNMERFEGKPTVQELKMPVFKPDTETGIANKFDAPRFTPEKEDLFKHKDPNEVLSDYDLLSSIESMPQNKKDPRIIRLKYLQQAHTMLLEKMFVELGQKLAHKEISDRFWDTLPADIRGRYKDKIGSIRSKIREIYKQFPQHFEQYKKQNKPYFRKQEGNENI